MRLPSYIKPYPKIVASLMPGNGQSIYPFIFLDPIIYQDLQSATPQPNHLATLAHELHHRQRQQSLGWLRWGIQYCISRQFRFEEELSAYRVSMMVKKHFHEDFDTRRCAAALSGPVYLWSTSHDNALHHLKEAWSDTRPKDPKELIKF